MEIVYYGAACILITHKKVQILVDPGPASYNIKLPKIKADVTLNTISQSSGFDTKNGITISSAGEYEIKGVLIQAIPAQLHVDKPDGTNRGIIYTLTIEGLHVLITGNIAPQLSEKQLEAIGDVDILIVPVGGHGLTLDANGAAKLVSQLEPSFVIPIHYDDGKTKYPMPQDKVDTFLKEIGSENSEVQTKLKITGKEIGEGTKAVVLKPQT